MKRGQWGKNGEYENDVGLDVLTWPEQILCTDDFAIALICDPAPPPESSTADMITLTSLASLN